jgi:hypothetical protein
MKNLGLLIGTMLGTLALIVAVAYFSSGSGGGSTAGAAVDRDVIEGGARNVEGPEDARVTVVEYSDFECPACKSSQAFVKQLKEQYGDLLN